MSLVAASAALALSQQNEIADMQQRPHSLGLPPPVPTHCLHFASEAGVDPLVWLRET